jgi:hypothetical protein
VRTSFSFSLTSRFYYGGGVLHDLQVLLLAGAKIPDTRFGVEALPGDIF